MDQEKYNELLSIYKRLFETGQNKITDLISYLSTEQNLQCSLDSQFGLEYYLFGKKIRTELRCSFDDLDSKKGHIVTLREEKDEHNICSLIYLHDRWFDIDGYIERATDFPSGYFLKTVAALQKRFKIEPINLIPI